MPTPVSVTHSFDCVEQGWPTCNLYVVHSRSGRDQAVDRAGSRRHGSRLGRGKESEWNSGKVQGYFVASLPKRLATTGTDLPGF